MINARRHTLLCMKLQGILPMHQILDNENSQAYTNEIRNTGMTYQLVPPYNHRRNISDRAIQTWKNHFVRVLSGAAATLPLHLRCQAFPQAVRPLLLLGQSNVNPNISSYSHVYGHTNITQIHSLPLAWSPLSMTSPIREYLLKTMQEGIRPWNFIRKLPFLENLMQQTHATRVSVTVIHRHKYISNPAITPVEAVISAAKNLVFTLKGKMPQYLQESLLAELTRTSQIFSEAVAVPKIPGSQSAPPVSQTPQPKPRRYPRITTTPPKPLSPLYPQIPPLPTFPPRVEPSVAAPRVESPAPTPQLKPQG